MLESLIWVVSLVFKCKSNSIKFSVEQQTLYLFRSAAISMLHCWYYLIFFRFGQMKHEDSSFQVWSGPLIDRIMLSWCLGKESNPKSQKSPTGMRIPCKDNKILRIYDVGNADSGNSHVNTKGSQDLKNLRFSRDVFLLLFSCWATSSSLRPHVLQHARLPCTLLSPGVCSNSCLLSQWY